MPIIVLTTTEIMQTVNGFIFCKTGSRILCNGRRQFLWALMEQFILWCLLQITRQLQVNNVNVSANIPSEVASLGNLQVDGVQVSGDIVSGINIGNLAPGTAKSITFEGKTQSISTQATKAGNCFG